MAETETARAASNQIGRHRGSGWRSVFPGEVRPVPGTIAGLIGVAIVEIAFGPLQGDVQLATKALALVVPVVAAALIGGRWPAYIVAAAATLGFAFLAPPIGSPRVHLAEDFVALCVFSAVALAVSTAVARRMEGLAQIEYQRRLLLRSVSHDLRTPLSTIRLASSELREGPHGEDTRQKLCRLIEDQTEQLDRLVANLLSLSRIEAGALVPLLQSVDVHELVEVCGRQLHRLFVEVRLEVEFLPGLPFVELDYTLMSQVVVNLLENAARHSPKGGTVRLVVSVSPSQELLLEVSDEGPGVTPDEAKLVFEPFRSGLIAGTSGIGLAICKAVVEAHRGRITVDKAPSGGALFTVTLPGRSD